MRSICINLSEDKYWHLIILSLKELFSLKRLYLNHENLEEYLRFTFGVMKWKVNKWGGRNFHEELINGEVLIRMSRVEKSYKINKRACLFIRHLRVETAKIKMILSRLIFIAVETRESRTVIPWLFVSKIFT